MSSLVPLFLVVVVVVVVVAVAFCVFFKEKTDKEEGKRKEGKQERERAFDCALRFSFLLPPPRR